jgi:hypothetical protein
MCVPSARKQKLGIAGTDRQIRDADFCSLIKNLAPMMAAIYRFVDASLRVRAVSMSEGTHVDDTRVLGIYHDPADLARILQPHVSPRVSAVH